MHAAARGLDVVEWINPVRLQEHDAVTGEKVYGESASAQFRAWLVRAQKYSGL